jgi:hypothetical protein
MLTRPSGARRTVPWPLAPWLLAVVAALGCEATETPHAIISPEHLRRQVEDLRALIQAAEQGTLLPNDRLLVAVDERTVRDLSRLGLPREQDVWGSGGRLRVRIDALDVEFRDGHGLVRLDGRVHWTSETADDALAELAVLGRVDRVEVDADSGSLRGQVTLIGLEVKRIGLSDEGALQRRLLEALASLNPQLLSLLSESLVLPVRLERDVQIRGRGDGGPVIIRSARFPLSARVVDLLAFDRRLWVVLEVDAGDWTPLEAEPPTDAEESGR